MPTLANSTLAQGARSYLEAGGYRLKRAEPDFFDFEGPAANSSNNRILLWSDGETRSSSTELDEAQRAQRQVAEEALLHRFATEMAGVPGATGYFLVAGRQGFSQRFISEATRLLGEDGGVRVAIEFFDAPYRIERSEARRARSALAGVLQLAGKVRRVAQPFSLQSGSLQPGQTATAGLVPGSDLVEHLETAIRDPHPAPRLRIIDGPAGSGKTIAFNALALSLFEEFAAAKKARHQGVRPILFLPEHLRGAGIGYVDDIIAAVADSDMAAPTTPEQFKWLLMNGHALWMFDGLDEFYSGGSDFFTFVEEALNAPGSKAQFVICARDSLLSSSPPMREFVDRQMAAGHATEIYELSPWTSQAWRQLAWLELENGREGASNSSRVNKFVASLERSAEVAAMARLPFYCSVLLNHFSDHGSMPHDEFDVLEMLVESMIRREHGKRVFRWQDFVDVESLAQALEDEFERQDLPAPNGDTMEDAICCLLDEQAPELLFELIGGLAHRLCRTGMAGDGLGGFSADEASDLIAFGRAPYIRDGDDAALLRLRTSLVRFAFFGAARKVGSLDFTHEILAEFFAARYAVHKIERALCNLAAQDGRGNGQAGLTSLAETVAMAVGTTEVPATSLFHRYFARQTEKSPVLREGLHLVLKRGDVEAGNVRVFLSRLLGMDDELGGHLLPAAAMARQTSAAWTPVN
jgi:hypothetical protein